MRVLTRPEGLKPIKKTHKYKILKTYTLQEIEALEGADFIMDEEFPDKPIRMHRANDFIKIGYNCVGEGCEVKGTHFALGEDNGGGLHMDLYGYEDGELIMLTIDHIKPKSKGGKNHVKNYQNLCKICNELKSDTYEEPIKTEVMKTSELYVTFMSIGECAKFGSGPTIVGVYKTPAQAEIHASEIRLLVAKNWNWEGKKLEDHDEKLLKRTVEVITLEEAIEEIKKDIHEEYQSMEPGY